MGSSGSVVNFYTIVLLFLALTYTNLSFSFPPSSSLPKSYTHLCLPNQRDALLRFKNAYNITTWDEHVDCCRWDGITCDPVSGDVIGVYQSYYELRGTINHITYLSPLYNLQELMLEGNLHGVIPLELSYFSKLNFLFLRSGYELTMESRSLRMVVQNLTQLEYLDLGGVKISGDPFNALVNISNALKSLHLFKCDLHGLFPESIFHLPNLHDLHMGENNDLMVSFPTLNWSSPLELLDLSFTNFSGRFPNSIGDLKNLVYLGLSSLHFSNPLTSSIENLTRLSALSLSSFTRSDVIPSSLCRLSSLKWLYLPHNQFSGMIPQCLGNLTKLEDLDLSYNQLSGLSLPSSTNFTKLGILHVSSNIINDTITQWLQVFPNLYVIDLAENNFHGDIPPSICKSAPWIVDLSNNRLAGAIPPCLIKYSNHKGQILNLRMNKLEGTIPNAFPLNCTIVELDLSENRLQGPLPRSMVNCSDLVVLELGNNSIEDFFPNWLETLLELQILVLNFNKLHGEVKTLLNYHPFPKLMIFDISNNNFTGLLPVEYIGQFDAMKNISSVPELGSIYLEMPSILPHGYSMTITMKGWTIVLQKVLEALKIIDFSKNNFHGEIPKIIGSLITLKGLNLSHNNLIGKIPPSIQNMTSLEWLDLSSNKLTDEIPVGLAQLTELEILNLSYNELRGMIPKGKQFDTFGKDSFLGNAGLCRSQIAVTCVKLDTPKQPPSPHIEEEDNFNIFDWKIILIGYGCGLSIGLSIGYISFELRRPEWFVSLVEEKLLKKIMRQRRRANRLCRT